MTLIVHVTFALIILMVRRHGETKIERPETVELVPVMSCHINDGTGLDGDRAYNADQPPHCKILVKGDMSARTREIHRSCGNIGDDHVRNETS